MTRLILFVCNHNAGRSVMAEAFFNAFNRNPAIKAKSAGLSPKAQVNPVVLEAMKEKGVDVSGHVPRLLSKADADAAVKIFTMGCTDGCPLTPAEKTEDWKLDDPAGKSIQDVRKIRDDVEKRVKALLKELE